MLRKPHTRPTIFKPGIVFLWQYKQHMLAGLLLVGWSWPLIATGNSISFGDFSFFSQAYEAIRISIIDYHQFPWFNPWISGGVPLYANPQVGLFSLQTLLVFLFGAPFGLKLTIVLFNILGYISMYILLRRYFKVDTWPSAMLSLLWVFCTFFVAHLPDHFTFIWYLTTPCFIYLALTVRGWHGGLLLGGAFAVMGLSQIHNPFVHIAFVCAVILLVRLLRESKNRLELAKTLTISAGLFVLFVGHRLVMAYENVHDFARHIPDLAPSPHLALLGLVLPLSNTFTFNFISYPNSPGLPYSLLEVTATLGIAALTAVMVCLFFIGYHLHVQRSSIRIFSQPVMMLAVATVCFLLALGDFAPWAPYNLLKLLPVLADMRVSTRWFLGVDLALLIFIGVMIRHLPKATFVRFLVTGLVTIGALEMFILNAGSHALAVHAPSVIAPKSVTAYQFAQTSRFGEQHQLPTGDIIPDDGHMPARFREYEATTYNLGVLYANDALVQLYENPDYKLGHPTCPIEQGCEFVRTGNAEVVSWSPNKIVLERTAPGKIQLNMNNSSYFVINGQRSNAHKVAEPFRDFVLNVSEDTKTITIEVTPKFQL